MKGWTAAPLESLCTTFADGDWIETKDQADTGIRLIQTGNVGDGFFKDRGERARYISPETFKRLRCTEIVAGDCLISRLPDPVGRATLIPDTGERMITAVDCTIVRFEMTKMLPAFFVYFSQSLAYQASVDRETTGTTRKRISRSRLGEVQIPLPPLDEQRRIAAILDEAFAGLAVMRQHAEANLKNARALFDSHLNAIFSQRGEGWVETTIEKEADIKVGFAFKSTKYVKDGARVRLLRGDNIIQGALRWEDCKFWPADDVAEYADYVLSDGDIVLAMDRTWVKAGIKFAQLSAEDLPALLVQRVARLRTDGSASQRYLFHVLGSGIFTKYVLDIQTGLGVPHISGKQIAAFRYQKPPKAKEAEIVEAIDALSEDVSRLESLYGQKLAAIDELKQSILHRAFSGALSAKDALAA